MNDNVTLPGTGAVIATDDVGGVQFQIVKIAYGADGAATVMDFMPASQATLAAILAAFKPEDSPHANGDLGLPLLAMRNDSDVATVGNDGDYSLLKMDETGRLKVSTQPATYLDVVGVISANGQSVFSNVDRASNVTITMVASALVNHAFVFEFSNNSTNGTDGNWYRFQAVRTDSNNIETNPGVLTSTPVYGWEASVNAYKWVRVRATSHTSGTATYTIKQGTYATEPIPAAQASATQPVSGTVGLSVGSNLIGDVALGVRAGNANASAVARVKATAGTNATILKASPGRLLGLHLYNNTAAVVYFKLYNVTAAPVPATDVPFFTIPIPPNSARDIEAVYGMGFGSSKGIGYAITTGIADNDTGAVAADSVHGVVTYA